MVDAAREPSTWQAPGPELDASSLKGKRIFVLADGTSEFAESFAGGVKAAGEALGMTVKRGNGNLVTTQDIQALRGAINEKVDAIIFLALTPATISSALKEAQAAGIPTIGAFTGDPALPSADDKANGVTANATICYSCIGELLAGTELLRSGTDMKAYVQDFLDYPASEFTVKGWKDTTEKYCPECETTYQHVPLSDPSQQTTSAAQVASQDPKATVIFPVLDLMVPYVLPPVTAAGAASRINVISQNANLAQMQAIQNGSPQKTDVGTPVAWAGWASVDQAVRAMLGMDPVADEKIPFRLFDETNIKDLDLDADQGTWYGNDDYASKYKTLWGVANS
ncbi:sugar ABC transporter substrate-binding protein [Rhodococcus sp. NPDC057529]|uniref:sugar ABC transporter substrate-binding protein n=1 Tax=Rhodococcus sp. NPDC057529 TaxID=3346158 RepID=UPI00366F4277